MSDNLNCIVSIDIDQRVKFWTGEVWSNSPTDSRLFDSIVTAWEIARNLYPHSNMASVRAMSWGDVEQNIRPCYY